MDFPIQNTGVIHEVLQGAYVIGDPRREYERVVIAEDGDLRKYRPPEERQSNPRPTLGQLYDSMSCVSQSNGSAIETDVKALLIEDKLPLGHEKFLRTRGFLNDKNEMNVDEQMLAKESGTTPQGNSMDRVAETGRKIGYAPGRFYDWEKFTWDSYYAPTPESQLKIGQEWNEYFQVWHYWLILGSNGGADAVVPVLQENLKYGAIQIANNTHAFLNLYANGTKATMFETYPPFFRDEKEFNVNPVWAKLIVVTVKGDKPNIPYFPYFEKKKGQAGIAAYHKATDKMIYYENGDVFQTVSGEYSKAKLVDEWIREVDMTRKITIVNQ